jgi:hypothetical protein
MATTTTNFTFNLPAVGGDDDSWGTLLNSNWTSLDSILNGDGASINIDGITADGMTLTGVVSLGVAGKITETVYTLSTSGTINIDPANGTVQTIAMSGNVTFTESLANGEFVTLQITSVGTDTVTWPSMKWMFGSAPTLNATNANWVQLWQVAGQLYGSYLGYTS